MLKKTTLIDRYAVAGNPVSHSLSPQIHTLFAQETRQPIQYTTLQIPAENFKEAVLQFFTNGGKGLSVTVPFKKEAWLIADIRTPRAQKAGAANTLWMADNQLIADNTDGVGLIRDITLNHQISLKNKAVLIIGAGGAAQGVLQPLLDEKPKQLIIANRTASKADKLVNLFHTKNNLSSCSLQEVNGDFDMVINATSASLQGQTPDIPATAINSNTICYDMMYDLKKDTAFNQWAKQQHAKTTLDGLGMLIEQAAEQFFLWRNIQPKSAAVFTALKNNH
ncbi:Shikimate dehydrogenase (NADP(+)) [invertebrate metagenome]|uniref:shikimate dehydrogenase (NADP(+)) n=1 Tax=invertebrate metagenome TaxID=1711999 RepID=A0A2H9T6T9_9ZZZZ